VNLLDSSPIHIIAITIAIIEESPPLCPAVKEANVPTILDYVHQFLVGHLARPEQAQPDLAKLELRLRTFGVFCKLIEADIHRFLEAPPAIGYETWLREHNINPIAARMFAHLAVRRRNRIANEGERLPAIVSAVQFLAKPGHKKRAISKRINVLLSASQESSVIETIFHETGLNESEFISSLKFTQIGRRRKRACIPSANRDRCLSHSPSADSARAKD
jgi:hypothetical protein